MKLQAHRTVRIVLTVLAAMALMVPLVAHASGEWLSGVPGVAAAADDNDISGAAALPSSPVTGTLDYTSTDPALGPNDGDVFSVYLEQGQAFTAQVSGPKTADFVLSLYAPSAVSVAATDAPVVADTLDLYYPRSLVDYDTFRFGHVAKETGTYYLEVYSYEGTGTYTVDWARGAKPQITITPSHTITYGKSTALSGSVLTTGGTGIVGQKVELFSRSYLTDNAEYKRVASAETTVGGAYKFKVAPTSKTYYKVVARPVIPGHSFVQSSERSVKVRVVLTRPYAPTSVYRARSFKVYGYVKPKHTSGNRTVHIYKYKWEKKKGGTYGYVYKSRTRATNYNSSEYPTKTKYSVRTTLPSRGTWKLVAKALDDGKHATTESSRTKIRVR